MSTLTEALFPEAPTSPDSAERDIWTRRWRALVARCDRTVAVAIALRRLRSATAVSAILAAVGEIITLYLGAETYAIVTPEGDGWRLLAAQGLHEHERRALTRAPAFAADVPLAWCPLGTGEWTLGWLAVFRLRGSAPVLDAFAADLLEALAPQVAVAMQAAFDRADTPTQKLPSRRRVKVA